VRYLARGGRRDLNSCLWERMREYDSFKLGGGEGGGERIFEEVGFRRGIGGWASCFWGWGSDPIRVVLERTAKRSSIVYVLCEGERGKDGDAAILWR